MAMKLEGMVVIRAREEERMGPTRASHQATTAANKRGGKEEGV
jgi:hypothetical protein